MCPIPTYPWYQRCPDGFSYLAARALDTEEAWAAHEALEVA